MNYKNNNSASMFGLSGIPEGYTIKGCLGRGGFGDVYLVTEDKTNQDLAMKHLQIVMISSTVNYPEPVVMNIINNEIVNMKKCSEISEVVKYISHSITGKTILIFMEYCGYGTLDGLISKEYSNGLPVKILHGVIKQIVSGIYKIHKQGIVHGDIKPMNIFIFDKKEMTIKIGDLGLSTNMPNSNSIISRSTRQGSSDYMSPEDFTSCGSMNNDHSSNHSGSTSYDSTDTGERYQLGYKSDVYALGITLIHLCYGNRKIEYEKFRSDKNGVYFLKLASQFNESCHLNRDLIAMIFGSIECDRKKRFSMDQLVNHRYIVGDTNITTNQLSTNVPTNTADAVSRPDIVTPSIPEVQPLSTISSMISTTPLPMPQMIMRFFQFNPKSDCFVRKNPDVYNNLINCATNRDAIVWIEELEFLIEGEDFSQLLADILSYLTHITRLGFDVYYRHK